MLHSTELDALIQIVGHDGLIVSATEKLPYETAARYGTGTACAVVRPADAAQVSALMRFCGDRKLPFVPQSGNTGLVLGSTPDASGRELVISLERLRGTQIDVDDRTVTVGAGVRLSALNSILDPHGLCLPIDVGSDPMIGGMVATNTGGARFLRYGDMRRHVLGLEVVLPDESGTVLKLGGALRKDNARLDLRQVFIGSCGALGIITSATLEVQPKRRQSAAALLIPRDEAAILELMRAFEAAAGETLSAFEGMSRAALHYAFAHVPNLRNPFPEGIPAYAILVELATVAARRPGDAGLEATLESIVTGLAEQDSSPLADALFGPPERLWAIRHSLSEGLRAHGPVLGLDLSFRRSQVMAFRHAALRLVAADFSEYEVCDFGHIADGGVHFNLLCHRPEESALRKHALRDRLIALAVGEFGASFSGEHGIGRANQETYDLYTAPEIKQCSGAVAAVFSRFASSAVRFGTATTNLT